MNEFFLKILNMSISASWIILVVLVLRLLLKKAPKWINVLLWGIVAVRLICPFTIESAMSLMPSVDILPPALIDTLQNTTNTTQDITNTSQTTIGTSQDITDPLQNNLGTPTVDETHPQINNSHTPVIQEATATSAKDESINYIQLFTSIFSKLWIIGVALMLTYSIISYIRIKKKINTAVLLRNNIYQSEAVVSPFVLGIIQPKIYLPFNVSEQNITPIIAHEQAHIKRKDYLWKPIGFLLLTLHWFNPLVWLGYILLCRDIELACDEKAIKEMTIAQRADYSQALLTCSVNRHMITACPIAFGEVNVKNRIKNVLNYKKPTFWIILVAIISSIIIAACFLTNPVNSKDSTNDNITTDENKAKDDEVNTKIETDSPADTNTSIDINTLKSKYPTYFNLDKTKGLTVYVWQMSANSYYCGLLPNSDIGHTELEIFNLHFSSTSIDEMRSIVTYYYPNNTQKYVTVCPIIMPISSYAYNIDDKYIHKVNELFGGREIVYQMPTYANIFDTASFDIDNDGIKEECSLGYGPTSGIDTFTFSVYENGELEYFNIFASLGVSNIHFDTNENGQVQLCGTQFVNENEPYTRYMSLAILDGNVSIFSDEQDITYWGEQGIDSPFAPK